MVSHLNLERTALVLIGFQNDYFHTDGILVGALEDQEWSQQMLRNTLKTIQSLEDSPALIVSAPIIFTPDYSELHEPIGILKLVQEQGAFKDGESGSETIPELLAFGSRIVEVPGRRGLNAFSNTELGSLFQARGIENVMLAGVVTSICIDSTGRAAQELGYKVTILSDCTAGRTGFEREFYCEKIFPLYAKVLDASELLESDN
jgi:nicotinamidase-related amidase